MSEFDPAIKLIRQRKWMPKIAAGLNIARQAPYEWKRVPAERVLAVSKITGMKPYEIRPDLYPNPRKGAANGW